MLAVSSDKSVYIHTIRRKEMNFRFERDKKAVANGDSSIIRERKAELDKLEQKIRAERNGFRIQCLAQELVARRNEYKVLDAMI